MCVIQNSITNSITFRSWGFVSRRFSRRFHDGFCVFHDVFSEMLFCFWPSGWLVGQPTSHQKTVKCYSVCYSVLNYAHASKSNFIREAPAARFERISTGFGGFRQISTGLDGLRTGFGQTIGPLSPSGPATVGPMVAGPVQNPSEIRPKSVDIMWQVKIAALSR